MTIFYLDPLNGNDASDGSTWGNAWKTWNSGPTAARIAPGDTVRIAKSPDPTLIGTGQWTCGPLPATKNIVASSNASPINVQINSHGYVTGDVVYIVGHTTNLAANGYWVITYVDANNFTLNNSVGIGTGGASGTCLLANARVVKLSSAVNVNILPESTNWSAIASGCTCSHDTTDWKSGYSSNKFVLTSAVGVERVAYLPTANPLDLSGYQQISFWVKSTVTLAAGDFVLRLCSDSSGETVVDTFNIPAVVGGSPWTCFTVNKGSALGSSIRSVVLYQAVDKGALTISLDNIIACKSTSSADSLCLSSLITKNSTAAGSGSEGFYCIKSIENNVIVLDDITASSASVGSGYWGTTESCNTYKRVPYRDVLSSTVSATVMQPQEAGSISSYNEFSGGWNTSTTEQDGCTIYDGASGWGRVVFSQSYWKYIRLNFVRYAYNINCSAGPLEIIDMNTTSHATTRGIAMIGQSKYSIANCNNNGDIGIEIAGVNSYLTNKNCNCNRLGSSYGIYTNVNTTSFLSLDNVCNNGFGINMVSGTREAVISNIHTVSNGTAGIYFNGVAARVFNALQEDTWSCPANFNNQLYSQKHNRTAGNHVMLSDGATVTLQTTTSVSGSAWDVALTSSRTTAYPVIYKLVRAMVTVANKQVTLSVNVKKSHATNVAAAIIIRGNQIGGVTTDQIFTVPSNTDWNTISAYCTPTEIGCIEFECLCWYVSGTGDIYIDSLMNVIQEP